MISPSRTDYNPAFFPDVQLNYTANILGHSFNSDAMAITTADESLEASHYTWRQLYEMVRRASRAMRVIGVKKGDRVVGENDLTYLVWTLKRWSISYY